MNLFDVGEKYYSHPKYPYRKHIQNISNSFNDCFHKEAASYHDLGKLKKDFQNFINNQTNKKTTHALEGAFLFLQHKNYKLNKKNFSVFLSILKHHSNLENVNSIAERYNFDEDIIDQNPNLLENLKEISSIINNIEFDLNQCCDLFDKDDFITTYDLSGIDEYFEIKETFSKLIFADKYEAIFKKKYTKPQPLLSGQLIKKLEKLLSSKHNNLSCIRNQARREIVENFKKNKDKNIFIIEAPTGIGKTFSALQLALEIHKVKNKKRIISALPMTSIIDQTHEEYAKIFDKHTLMKYHYLSYSKDYLNSEDDEIYYKKQKNLFLRNSWSEDNVIITTFNQILDLFYSNTNNDLIKFWTIRNSVIIFDEIQAVPRILLKDFSATIEFLAKNYNIDFILMSATIPGIVQHLSSSLVVQLLDNKYFSMNFNNRYLLKMDNKINNPDKLADAIIEKNKNNSVLAVLNTKKMALNIFESVLKKTNEPNYIFLLTSLFLPKHRKIIIRWIKRLLAQKKKVVLISTQVIEAGVDLDFDIGFREFSPFYSIIQTAGRINRENRCEIKKTAKLLVIPEISKKSPYHQTDILKNEVEDLLKEPVRENQLLSLLKSYFSEVQQRTSPDFLLYEKMKDLEFEDVSKKFNSNYMVSLPCIISVFFETKEGMYKKIKDEIKNKTKKMHDLTISLEQKMEIKANLKEIYKSISLNIINVPKNETKNLDNFFQDNNLKVCKYDELSQYYSTRYGWNKTEEKDIYF